MRFLLDEDTESALARHLSKSTHDVERVVDVLGPGATDGDVVAHARSTDRIIITHDDDFADTSLHDEHRGVFYCPNQRLPPFEMYRIITAVIETPSRRSSISLGSGCEPARGGNSIDWIEQVIQIHS